MRLVKASFQKKRRMRQIPKPKNQIPMEAGAGMREEKRRMGRGELFELFADEGVGLDLDQHFGDDEAADLDQTGGGPDFAEKLAVRPANSFPVLDVCHIDAGANDVLQIGPGAAQRGLDILERR